MSDTQKVKWTHDDQMLAHASGWGVFHNDDHGTGIERLDDPQSVGLSFEPLESDEAAEALVKEAAAFGDLLAQKALAFIEQEAANV